VGGGSTFRLGFETGSDTGPPSVLAGLIRLACTTRDALTRFYTGGIGLKHIRISTSRRDF
jgi:hypothetical protein